MASLHAVENQTEPGNPGQSSLEQIVSSVFATILKLDLRPLRSAAWKPEENRVTAIVRISGAGWCGAVGLQVPDNVGCELAARYLSLAAPERVNDDVHDLLGELINAIAVNVQSALFPGAELSLPSAVDGNLSTLACGLGGTAERVAFAFGNHVIWAFLIASTSGS